MSLWRALLLAAKRGLAPAARFTQLAEVLRRAGIVVLTVGSPELPVLRFTAGYGVPALRSK